MKPCLPSSVSPRRRFTLLHIFVAGVFSFVSLCGAEVPIKYDLRTAGPADGSSPTTSWVTAVQNQSNQEDCWSFATATALNSNMLQKGLLDTTEAPPPIQVSSWTISANNGQAQWFDSPYQDAAQNYSWGGWESTAMGYLTRGVGAWPTYGTSVNRTTTQTGGGLILDKDDSLNPFPQIPVNDNASMAPYIPRSAQQVSYLVRSVTFLDDDQNGLGVDAQRAAVKAAILKNGAVTTGMNASPDVFSYTTKEGNPYYNPAMDMVNYISFENVSPDHEVTIIGWDDNIELVFEGVTYTGGWLVQNSWGTDWGWAGKGTFWASYDDPLIGRQYVSSYEVDRMKIPDDAVANAGVMRSGIVIQNQVGPYGLDNVGDGRDAFSYVQNNNGPNSPNTYGDGEHNKAASVLSYDRPFQLVSVGIFSPQRANDPDNLPFAEVTFYSDWTDHGPDGQLFPTQRVTFDGIQYRMFDLENVLPTLTSIVVVVDYRNLYTVEQGTYAIPYEGYVDGMPAAESGLSYYYDVGSDRWVDLADSATNGVFFLKGIPAEFPSLKWDGAHSGGDWSDGMNWKDGSDGSVAWSNENDVRFSGLDAAATVTLNTDVEIGDFIWDGESGDTLTLAPGTGSVALRYKTTSFFLNTGTTLNVDVLLTDWSGEERELILTGGTTVFALAQAYTGKTQINYAATLVLAGTAGDVAGDIETYGTLSLERTNDYELAAKVSGPGGLTVDTAAKVTVTNDQDYTGYTTIEAGTLALTTGKLSDKTPLNIKGGKFDISGLSDDHLKIGSIEGTAGELALGHKTLEFGDNGFSTSLTSVVSGEADGKLVKKGGGVLTLNGANTLDGKIEIEKGTIVGASAGAFGAADVKVKSDGVLKNGLAGGASLAIMGDLELEGGRVALGDLSSSTAVFDIGGHLRTSGTNTISVSELQDPGAFLIFSGGGTTASLADFLFVYGSADSELSGVSLGYDGGNVVMTVSSDASYAGSVLSGDSSFLTFVPDSPNITVEDGARVASILFNGNAAFTGGAFTLTAGVIDTGDYTVEFYNSRIDVPGDLTKMGSGSMYIYNDVRVAGETDVADGLLKVEGSLTTPNLIINQGAELGGSGFVFANVFNSGVLAPGSSPGTLTISGSLTLTSTSVIELEIASLSVFDRIIVSGTANLNGALDVIPFGGFDLEYGQQFQFLTANAVTGEFDEVNAPDGFRGRILIDGGDVTLLIAPESYTLVAENQNQRNVAAALDSFIPATSGDKLEVSTALDLLTADEYPAAFNAIMPSFYETLGTLSLSATTTLGQLIDQRLSSVRLGARGFSVQGMGNVPTYTERSGKSVLDGKKDILEPVEDNPWSVWVMGNGIFGHNYSVANIPSYRYASGGVLVGGDYRWSEQFATGAFVGYQGAYSTYANDGKVSMNGVNFGAYATYDAGNGFYANGIVMGGYLNYIARRPINFGTVDRTASSNPGSGNVAALIETGYDFKAGGFTFGPVINAQYSYIGVSPFTENGADSLDLRVGQQNINSLQTNLGGRIAYTWNVTSSITIIPEVRVFWNHEFLQNPTTFGASLDGGNGPGFDYTTTTPARDSVFAGVGINAMIGDRWNASVYYNVNFGSSTSTTNAVSASLGFSF